MFIMVRGKVETRIGGKQSSFPEGEMMLVPAGVSHELWNPYEQPAEFIILMFGQGA
jgi:mannose-6-phosphate isomerase-like protein (cupin superfamily)